MKTLILKKVKSKLIIPLFETVRLSVLISTRNFYMSLKMIIEFFLQTRCRHLNCNQRQNYQNSCAQIILPMYTINLTLFVKD